MVGRLEGTRADGDATGHGEGGGRHRTSRRPVAEPSRPKAAVTKAIAKARDEGYEDGFADGHVNGVECASAVDGALGRAGLSAHAGTALDLEWSIYCFAIGALVGAAIAVSVARHRVIAIG